MNVGIYSFSSRRSPGNCKRISDFIMNRFELCNFSYFNIDKMDIHHCSNCEYQCFHDNLSCIYNKDESKSIFTSIILNDLSIFIVPIYCDLPPSSLFILNERSQSFFKNFLQYDNFKNKKKAFILISNTNICNVKNIIKHMFQVEDDNSFLVLSSHDYNLKSINGDLIQEKAVKDALYNFISKFIKDSR